MLKRQLPVSYIVHELNNNILRLKKLAQLESRFTLQDLANHELKDKLNSLQSENQLLKQRLLERQQPLRRTRKALHSQAFQKAEEILGKRTVRMSKRNKSQYYPYSDHKPIQRQMEMLNSSMQKQKNRSLSTVQENSPGQNITLSKQVYVGETNTQQRLYSSALNHNQPNYAELTFKKEEQPESLVRVIKDKFPSPMKEFKVHTTPDKFKDCVVEKDNIQVSSIVQKWKSEIEVDPNSAVFSQCQQSDHKRRKTFLSVVSQSAVIKKH